ncbi:unnamed protein product [Spirodela intermedia]|uniref:Uncharacterized protein n=1 Tax=Spirodela intermedia TaxID=51605 RepID=A0A7I8L9G4_SPIIN|nr:unnamed protein product [Spirodela intermedia]
MGSLSILSSSAPPLSAVTNQNAGALPARILPLSRGRRPPLQPAALKSPRGFGPAPVKRKPGKKQRKGGGGDDDEEDEEEDDHEEEGAEERDEGTIPEVVTNRMMKRMGLSVGAPLAVGLLFFPFFYYLKVGAKIDVPTWVPFLVSFFFFGTALLGVSYGIVSASWDPLREGSLLGWNEAQRNWPVFWQSIFRGGDDGKSSRRGGGRSRKR